jgi:hypothetical protein
MEDVDLFEWFSKVGEWEFQIMVSVVNDSLIFESMITSPDGSTEAMDLCESKEDAIEALKELARQWTKDSRSRGLPECPRVPEMTTRRDYTKDAFERYQALLRDQ